MITPAVKSKIEKVFSHDNWEKAVLLIRYNCGNTLPLMGSNQPEEYDRIRFAVIKLSKGNLDVLEKVIGQSHSDWRDVLVGAGFGYDCQAHLHWAPETETTGAEPDGPAIAANRHR